MRLAQRRVERELRQYDGEPEVRCRPFFRRSRGMGDQSFRSFIQVNLYPRPRDA
jgi:hypothetical protein